MSIPDRVSPDPELPEQHLLRGGDRLQDYASAFLRGEITGVQYSEMTLAEINRRAPIDFLVPLGDDPVEAAPVQVVSVQVVSEQRRVPEGLPAAPTVTSASAQQHGEADRSIVLARAFVGGRIRSTDFLRLIRDC